MRTIRITGDFSLSEIYNKVEEKNKISRKDVFEDIKSYKKITNTFGCHVNKLNKKKFRKVLNILNAQHILEVPLREKGYTASGKSFRCHTNVNTLMKKYGGSRILGYAIAIVNCPYTGRKEYVFNSHSCWKTPEGKLVDVTDNIRFGGKQYLNKNNKRYIRFIPMFEENVDKSHTTYLWSLDFLYNFERVTINGNLSDAFDIDTDDIKINKIAMQVVGEDLKDTTTDFQSVA